MKSFKTFTTALSAVFITLATVGTVPALAGSLEDEQAPRGAVKASTTDTQAPRGQDAQAPATVDDAQSPRSN